MEKTLLYEGTETRVHVIDQNEHIQKHWMQGRFYETQRNGVLNVIYQREKKGGKFIDIGASIGNHSLFFANVMGGEVIAFEPQHDSFLQLQGNNNLNRLKITTINAALGERECLCDMVSESDENVGMYQVSENPVGDTIMMPLDHWQDWMEGYDVIKIDVEHYNKQVLTGARITLTQGTGNVYIEAETANVLNDTDRLMGEYGYKRVPDLIMNHTPTYLYCKINKKA